MNHKNYARNGIDAVAIDTQHIVTIKLHIIQEYILIDVQISLNPCSKQAFRTTYSWHLILIKMKTKSFKIYVY